MWNRIPPMGPLRHRSRLEMRDWNGRECRLAGVCECSKGSVLEPLRPMWQIGGFLDRLRELPLTPRRTLMQEDVMKAYFQNLPTKTWLLLVIPAVVLAYPIARIVVPAVLHAVVPEVVRSVLSVI